MEKCKDVDECFENAQACHLFAECVNTPGNYTCKCQEGFEGDGYEFCDLNECETGEADCHYHAVCINIPGSYTCQCKPSYTGDGRENCDYVPDPCLLNNGDCGVGSLCYSHLDGTHDCRCPHGYDGDGETCLDRNECDDDGPHGHHCDDNAICTNYKGGYTCDCKRGFGGMGRLCGDINECRLGRHTCSPFAICYNRIGGYECVCKDGFQGNGFICEPDIGCNLNNASCHKDADCEYMNGGYTCQCRYGFRGDGQKRCFDINECAKDDANGCSKDAKCKNKPGGYDCECKKGYQGNGYTCEDVDECLETGNDAVCDIDSSDCKNKPGSYDCECKVGFVKKGGKCIDVDECEKPDDNECSNFSDCTNTDGGYTCKCMAGYQGDGITCIDVDECAIGQSECGNNTKCINEEGSHSCECLPGYKGDGKNCEDVDECKEGVPGQSGLKCDGNATCENSDGGFSCECNENFIGNGFKCEALNPCDVEGTCQYNNSACVAKDNKAVCVCEKGYQGDGQNCIVEDACASDSGNDCHENADCKPKPEGGYDCQCKKGYHGDGKTCEDIDECDWSSAFGGGYECQPGSECVNTNGSYSCQCKENFDTKDGKCITTKTCSKGDVKCDEGTECTDSPLGAYCRCTTDCWQFDLCAMGSHDCDPELSLCEPIEGSYKCVCKNGGDYGTGCKRDTCAGEHRCSEHADCISIPTSKDPLCRCKDGFTGNGLTCTDINECKTITTPSVICINTPGSFKLQCRSGSKMNVLGECEDVNECATGDHDCPENSDCVNKVGRIPYECVCRTGFDNMGESCVAHPPEYKRRRRTLSEDIDECAIAKASHPDLCKNGVCVNTQLAGYTCKCNEGYKNFGLQCENINECELPRFSSLASKCENAECFDVEGSYQCVCSEGYTMENGTCVDIDECELKHLCHGDSICINTEGSYTCICKPGFEGNGNECKDIDECGIRKDICGDPRRTKCINEPGTYKCDCEDGYVSKNGVCVDDDECGSMKCDENAYCVNKRGGQTQCICKIGYDGDGLQCKEVDECKERRNNCDINAVCTNTPGSFKCACNEGFTGDGNNCMPICRPGICPHTKECAVEEGKAVCKCRCFGPECLTGGLVCASDGQTYTCYADMVLKSCEAGKLLTVEYPGFCKKSCDDLKCGLNKVCRVHNQTGIPECICPPCEPGDESSDPVCTERGWTHPNKCSFKKTLCEMMFTDKIVKSGQCEHSEKCKYDNWGTWSECSATCGSGTKSRTRQVAEKPDGIPCPNTDQSDHCYQGPCPDDKCGCKGIEEECDDRAKIPKCICPRCPQVVDLVCAKIDGTIKTYLSMCQLRQTACRANSTFEFVHPGPCEVSQAQLEPLNCTVVPYFKMVTTYRGCTPLSPVQINRCMGGCGKITGLCCVPQHYMDVFVRADCGASGIEIDAVKTISKCECIKEQQGDSPGA